MEKQKVSKLRHILRILKLSIILGQAKITSPNLSIVRNWVHNFRSPRPWNCGNKATLKILCDFERLIYFDADILRKDQHIYKRTAALSTTFGCW